MRFIAVSKTALPLTLLLAAGSLILFFIPSPVSEGSLWFERLWDLGHVVMFAAWNHQGYRLLSRRPLSPRRTIALLLALTLVVGCAIELIQAFFQRQSSWHDVGLDLAGAIIGLSLPPVRRLRLLAVPAILFALFPLATLVADRLLAYWQFPVILDNSTPFEQYRLGGKAQVKKLDQPDVTGFAIHFDTARYSMLKLEHLPADWRAYQTLELEFTNPEPTPLALNFTLEDRDASGDKPRYPDTFHRRYLVQPGFNRIVIALQDASHAPRHHVLDLSHIGGLYFYTMSLPQPRQLWLHRIALTTASDRTFTLDQHRDGLEQNLEIQRQ